MDDGLGYSQLNELLLLLGFDRISSSFFQYLYNCSKDKECCFEEYKHGAAFSSLDELEKGILSFKKTALLIYGNVKFAFKTISTNNEILQSTVETITPIEETAFINRHCPVLPLDKIFPTDAYLTGYIVEGELKQKLQDNPDDLAAQTLEDKRKEIVEKAKKNQNAYLTSDHLDVYVATSMRERHEYLTISKLTNKIFDHGSIRALKLRWFDPTQAYCLDRVDKGLSEALMLRRALCTIYLVQESDTLGKDSELASTLAQGKPVIAFVPLADDEYIENYFSDLQEANPDIDLKNLLLEQLKIFFNQGAWENSDIRNLLNEHNFLNETQIKTLLAEHIKTHYDNRAKILKEIHPLGIQVNLVTGVANGVLVVRTVDNCAKLIKSIVTRTLKVDLEERDSYTALVEQISGCVFRVMTKDTMLTNTFWNFYLDPAR